MSIFTSLGWKTTGSLLMNALLRFANLQQQFAQEARTTLLKELSLIQHMGFYMPLLIAHYEGQLLHPVHKLIKSAIAPITEYSPVGDFFNHTIVYLEEMRQHFELLRGSYANLSMSMHALNRELYHAGQMNKQEHENSRKDLLFWLFQWVNSYHKRLAQLQENVMLLQAAEGTGQRVHEFFKNVNVLATDIKTFNDGLRRMAITGERDFHPSLLVDSVKVRALLIHLGKMLEKVSNIDNHLQIALGNKPNQLRINA